MIVKSQVASKMPESIPDLKAEIEAAWYSTEPEICRNPVMSFRKRALALLRAKGRHTKY